MLHVAVQFPNAYNHFMQNIDPSGANHVLSSLFSSTFIEPDIVMAYEVVLESDREFLTSSKPEKVEYIFATLSYLAPNDESRLPNFGRTFAQNERKQKKSGCGSGGGKQGDGGGRRSKPKLNTNKSIMSSTIMTKVSISYSIFNYIT